jgi:DNA-binding LacI/PurR family transcriptional regulator
MRSRAEQLGYRVEEFWLRESGMTAARATQILGARGITGLVIAPQPSAGAAVELEWEKFSAVSIGYSLGRPNLHLVGPHQYRAIKLAMRELTARGYQRPGLVLLRASDDRVDQNWQAGYLVAQRTLAARDRLAPLLLENWNEAEFANWLETRRPDAVLTKFAEVLPALRRMKVAVPRALGVAVLTHATPGGDLAGVHENPVEVGAAAADYVTGMIHRNERGVPALPHRLLIDARWIDGRTVRAAPARAAVRKVATIPA